MNRSGGNYQSVASFDEIRPLIKSNPTQTANVDPAIHTDDISTPSLRTALLDAGNDDEMSRQQQQSMPGADGVERNWMQQVGTHKTAWDKLTGTEWSKRESHAPKLSALVRERSAVTRDGADRQSDPLPRSAGDSAPR